MSAQQNNSAHATQNSSLLSRLINMIIALPVVLIMTMLFSIFVEWSGIWFCNDDDSGFYCSFLEFEAGMGADHSASMLASEAVHINENFSKAFLDMSPLEVAGELLDNYDSIVKDYVSNNDYIMAAFAISKLVLLRATVLFFSIPAFLLFGGLGFICGLVERDLRRFGAGRESSDKFRFSLMFIVPTTYLCAFIYLSWPSSIHPSIVIVPFAASFGFFIFSTVSNYKKYA